MKWAEEVVHETPSLEIDCVELLNPVDEEESEETS